MLIEVITFPIVVVLVMLIVPVALHAIFESKESNMFKILAGSASGIFALVPALISVVYSNLIPVLLGLAVPVYFTNKLTPKEKKNELAHWLFAKPRENGAKLVLDELEFIVEDGSVYALDKYQKVWIALAWGKEPKSLGIKPAGYKP